MGKLYETIAEIHAEFIRRQPFFFVATAPLSSDGHINVSPKGLDTFRILDSNRVAYLDLTGSGNETSAHLLENGRITFMFCAFEGQPQILRLFGKGRTVLPTSPAWQELRPLFPDLPGVRQILVADIDQVQTSCGLGVPLMAYQGQRERLPKWADAKGEDGIARYHQERNAASLDGLPTPIGV